MSEGPRDLLNLDPSLLRIAKELKRSEASSIFEVELQSDRYALKVVSVNMICWINTNFVVS